MLRRGGPSRTLRSSGSRLRRAFKQVYIRPSVEMSKVLIMEKQGRHRSFQARKLRKASGLNVNRCITLILVSSALRGNERGKKCLCYRDIGSCSGALRSWHARRLASWILRLENLVMQGHLGAKQLLDEAGPCLPMPQAPAKGAT